MKTTRKAAIRNSKTRRSLRGALKAFQTSLSSKDKKKIEKASSKSQSALDVAVKKGIIHKNKAARKKKQLAQKSKSSIKSAAKKPASVTKKPVKKTTKKS